MKVISSLSINLVLCFALAIGAPLAAAASSGSSAKDLPKLEQKYFGHTFEADSPEARIGRIEQMIFGEENTGSVEDRINKILAISPLDESPAAPSAPPSAATTNEAGKQSKPGKKNKATAKLQPDQDSDLQNSAATAQTTNTAKPADADGAVIESFESAQYPHISALEQVILGKTDETASLADRLAKLETKAFGKPSTNADFSQRTDALDSYSENTLNIRIVRQEEPDEVTTYVSGPDPNAASSGSPSNTVSKPGATSQNPSRNLSQPSASTTSGDMDYEAQGASQSAPATQDDGETSDYPHITALEKAILGQTHVGEAVKDRLARMEATAFGSASQTPDLSQRTDALDAYAKKTLHKKAFDPRPEYATDADGTDGGSGGSNNSGTGSGHQQAGGPRPGISKKQIFAIAANTLLGAEGFGGAGMGLAAAGMGMDAMRAQQQAQQQAAQRADQSMPDAEDEDAAAFTKTPPPANARMLTKVSWAEAHVFGQTFSGMHLKQRLRQLSQELQYNTQKTDLQLMDDVDGIIKTVQTQVMHVRPIGSTPQPATH